MTSKQTENLRKEGKSSTYSYAPKHLRPLNLAVNTVGKMIMDNAYGYDVMSNVLSVVNEAAFPEKDISTVLDRSSYGTRQTISKTAGSKTQRATQNNIQ